MKLFTTIFIAFTAAASVTSISSCGSVSGDYHCECTVTVPKSGGGDTTYTSVGSSFNDTKENATNYCEGTYENTLKSAYPLGTVNCQTISE